MNGLQWKTILKWMIWGTIIFGNTHIHLQKTNGWNKKNLEVWKMTFPFPRRYFQIPWSVFGSVGPFRERTVTYPTEREKENHRLKSVLGRVYASSQEGILSESFCLK